MSDGPLVPVYITGDGVRHRVEVGGHEIGHACTSASVEIEGGSLPVLHLRLAAFPVVDEERAVVLLDDETVKALKAMGWTPPEGGGA